MNLQGLASAIVIKLLVIFFQITQHGNVFINAQQIIMKTGPL